MSLMGKIAKNFISGLILLALLNIFSPTPVRAELPSLGDLKLSGNNIKDIANVKLTVNGSIIIKNNATLRIINSTLIFGSESYNITLKEPSNGNPRLIIIDSNISCTTTKDYKGLSIHTFGNSSVLIKDSYFERVIINAGDSSNINIQKLTAAMQIRLYEASMLNATSLNFINIKERPRFTSILECFDNSKALISDTIAETSIYVRGRESSTLKLNNCGTSWTIELYEKSNLYLSGGKVEGRINLNDASYAEIYNPSFIKTLNASGYARAKIHNTTIIFSTEHKTVLSDFSTLYIEKVKVRQQLLLLGSAKLSAINSQLRQVKMYDSSVLNAVNIELENLAAYGSSTFFASGKSKLNCTFYEHSLALITNTYSTDFFISATDNAQLFILQGTAIGKLSLNKKATLYTTESKIQWLEVKDKVVASIIKTTIDSYLGILDEAKISIVDTKINILEASRASEISIEKSNVSAINAFDSSKINLKASFVGEITIFTYSVQCTFDNLSYTTIANCIAPNIITITGRGYTPTIILSGATVKSWNVFVKDSNINFTNCRLNTLKISGNSTIVFYNTTTSLMTVNDNSRVYVYWYVDVLAYNGTSVLVKNEKGEIVFQTNVSDKARIILLEKVVNASATIISNKYNLLFIRDGEQQQHNIELISNMAINLTASKGFEWYIILSIVITVIIILLTVVSWIRFRGVPKSKKLLKT